MDLEQWLQWRCGDNEGWRLSGTVGYCHLEAASRRTDGTSRQPAAEAIACTHGNLRLYVLTLNGTQ